MLPNRTGRFKAVIVDKGVDETGDNALATFVAKFRLIEELLDGEWTGLTPDESSFEITGYFYLEKRDHSMNDRTVESLKAALGWDGCDPFWLADTPMDEKVVQITIAENSYNGKTSLKVTCLDPGDSTGGGGRIQNATPERRRAILARLGPKLRATGTPAPAPKPPAPRPAPPPARKPATATREQAWDAYCKLTPEGVTDDAAQAEWATILAAGGIDDDATGAQWATFITKLPQLVADIPF